MSTMPSRPLRLTLPPFKLPFVLTTPPLAIRLSAPVPGATLQRDYQPGKLFLYVTPIRIGLSNNEVLGFCMMSFRGAL